MSIFSKRFNKSLLKEAEGPVAAPPSPVPAEDEEAFNATLDQDTEPGTFDDIEGAKGDLQNMEQAEKQGQVAQITEWIGKIGDMAEWLNGLEGNSVQMQLKNSPCDTLLDSISKSETKKITRIAQELSALREALKGYILSSDEDSDSQNHPYGRV